MKKIFIFVCILSLCVLFSGCTKNKPLGNPAQVTGNEQVTENNSLTVTPQEALTANVVLNQNWLCIPGKQVGPITSRSSIRDLEKAFGKTNVTITNKPELTDEGTRDVMLTTIYPGSADEAIVFWSAEGKLFKRPGFVLINKPGSRWKTAEGIGIGTTLAELNKINGKPFVFFGFGWANGGAVFGWGNGNLEKVKGLKLNLGLASELYGKYNQFSGDKKIISDEPGLPLEMIKVDSMRIEF